MALVIHFAECRKDRVSQSFIDGICRRIQSAIPQITITETRKVGTKNKYSHASFLLRKSQYEMKYGVCPTETLYHATAKSNVRSILKDNLDWRRVKRSRFGVGVSFSDDPGYANKFCNAENGSSRAFIVCEVLTGNALIVNSNYSPYPKKDIDTYRSRSRKVVVKFEDHTFYAKCVIYYKTSPSRPYRTLSTSSYDDDDNDIQQQFYALSIF